VLHCCVACGRVVERVLVVVCGLVGLEAAVEQGVEEGAVDGVGALDGEGRLATAVNGRREVGRGEGSLAWRGRQRRGGGRWRRRGCWRGRRGSQGGGALTVGVGLWK